MASGNRDEYLAYGDYHPRPTQGEGEAEHQDGERGFLGDAYRNLRGRNQPQQSDRPQNSGQNDHSGSTAPDSGSKPSFGLLGSSIFNKVHDAVHGLGAEVTERFTGRKSPTPGASVDQKEDASLHRYGSFARPKGGDDVKWYVDGCGYMWAVSRALEQAKETVWILDCEFNSVLDPTHRPKMLDDAFRLLSYLRSPLTDF